MVLYFVVLLFTYWSVADNFILKHLLMYFKVSFIIFKYCCIFSLIDNKKSSYETFKGICDYNHCILVF